MADERHSNWHQNHPVQPQQHQQQQYPPPNTSYNNAFRPMHANGPLQLPPPHLSPSGSSGPFIQNTPPLPPMGAGSNAFGFPMLAVPPPPPPQMQTQESHSPTMQRVQTPNGHHLMSHLPQDTAPTNAMNGRNLNVKDALSYLDQVKMQFTERPDVYNKFLDIMKDFKSQSIDTPGVIDRVSSLFYGHPSLIQGFNTFLPPGFRIECEDDKTIRVITPAGVQIHEPKPSKTERERDIYGGPLLPPHQITPNAPFGAPPLPSKGPTQPKREPVEFNHAISYVNKIKHRFTNEPEIYKTFLEILQTYQKESKPIQEVYAQVAELFHDQKDLLESFKEFLPDPAANQNVTVPKSGLPPLGNFSSAPPKDKKKRTANQDMSQSNGRSSGVKKPRTSKQPAVDISSLEPSLTPFIPEPVAPPKKVIATNDEMDFFAKVKAHINKQTTYNEFLKICNLYSQDIIDKNVLVEKVETFIGQDGRLLDWFKRFVGYTGEDHVIANQPTPGSRVDLNMCKAYGPSYRKLPRPEAQLPCSGRDEMCWAVLNDQWVSHPTWASEDSGFVHHKKNQYEEALLKVEEERYEYDLMIEANYRTIQLLEPIAARISGMTNEEKANFRLPLGLGGQSVSIYQKVIKRVYDKERGQEFIDALHEHPAYAVPVVLARLKQKDEEWRRAQRDWNKIWRESEAKVFYKSLDHQGVNFKSVDKKAMNPRTLQLEIETIRREQLAQRNPSRRKSPQFVFKIDDREVIQDVTRLLAVYMDTNSYSPFDREKLDLFISNFVPLFFSSTTGDDIKSPVKKRKGKNGGKESKENTPETEMEDSEGDDGVDDIDPLIAERVGETWITHGDKQFETGSSKKDDGPRRVFNFFGNSIVYIFFRYFQTIYSRLLEFKNLESFSQAEREKRCPNPIAAELGLRNTRFDEVENALATSGKAYTWLLELCDKMIENESDSNFEDSLRVVYGTKAYKMFTIEKVVGMLCKQIFSLISDTKAAQLVVLFEKDKAMTTTSTRQQMLYRLEAEELLGPEEQVYRLEWNDVDKTLSVQMIDKDDQTLNTAVTAEDRWNYYIETYTLSLPTEGIPRDRMSWPFLRRSIPDPESSSTLSKFTNDQISSSQGLEIKICLNTFKIFFLPHSEDSFFRRRKAFGKSKMRNEKWNSWLSNHWKKGLDPSTIESILHNGPKIFEKQGQVMEK